MTSSEVSPLVPATGHDEAAAHTAPAVDDATSVASELPHLFHLGIPVTLTMILEILPGMSSIALVGQMQSDNVQVYVDSVAIASMYFNVTSMAVVIGLATALDTLCTQAYGAGSTSKFGVYMQSALLGLVALLVPVTLLNVFSGQLLVSLGQDPAIASHASVFLIYSTLGLPGFCVYNVLKKLVQAHNIVDPMAVMTVLGNIIHLSLGYYLTNYTSLELHGPAVSRSVAYTAMAGMMLVYLAWINPVHKTWALEWSWAAATSHLSQFFAYGVPGMLMMVIEWAAFEILTLLCGLMDDHVVAIGVNSILMNLLAFMYTLFSGIGIAVNIRIGNLLGANKPDAAKVVMYAGFITTACVVAVVATSLVLGRHIIPALFIRDAVVIERTASAMLFIILIQISDAFNANCQGVLRATGHQDIGTYINTAAYFVVGIPLGAVAGFYFRGGLEGLWVGFTFGSVGALAVFAWFLTRIDWKSMATEAMARVEK